MRGYRPKRKAANFAGADHSGGPTGQVCGRRALRGLTGPPTPDARPEPVLDFGNE
jgi:hypothetical protein